MLKAPSYRSYDQDKIKFILERSFVPNLSHYKVLVVSDMMEDIVVIEGVIVDFNTKEMYIAPCYLPRQVNNCSKTQKNKLINTNRKSYRHVKKANT